jgi:hypothetical protein
VRLWDLLSANSNPTHPSLEVVADAQVRIKVFWRLSGPQSSVHVELDAPKVFPEVYKDRQDANANLQLRRSPVCAGTWVLSGKRLCGIGHSCSGESQKHNVCHSGDCHELHIASPSRPRRSSSQSAVALSLNTVRMLVAWGTAPMFCS